MEKHFIYSTGYIGKNVIQVRCTCDTPQGPHQTWCWVPVDCTTTHLGAQMRMLKQRLISKLKDVFYGTLFYSMMFEVA